MSRIILTAAQLQTLTLATDSVEICDPDGKVLYRLKPTFPEEEITRALRASKSPGPWIPAEEVRKTLQTLQDIWDKEGPFDRDKMEKILNEIRAARKSA